MDSEQLKIRIDSINKEMMSIQAHYAKLEGHLAESKHWLIELTKNENPELEKIEEHNNS